MVNHGINVTQVSSSVSTPVVAKSGIPFVIGTAPVQCATTTTTVGRPILCTSWAEALAKLGYSDNWKSYSLCEFMFSHFKLYNQQPVIFCNLLDPATMKTPVAAADITVSDHKAELPIGAINNGTLVVKATGGTGTTYVKDTDYSTYYIGESLMVEVLPSGACYDASQLNIAYTAVSPASVTADVVATGIESIEYCMSTLGVVPDIICAPGFSENVAVAAVMATKAAGINGMFLAKALLDISTDSSNGAVSYDNVFSVKTKNNLTDKNEILCWPRLTMGGKSYHMSTHIAGVISMVDGGNEGCPYESPSNKALKCDGMALADGTEINLSISQANILNEAGVVTALNFMGAWNCWGNYTACYPINVIEKDSFIAKSRVVAWVGNSLIQTFWSKLDKPMNRRLIDSIMDTCNIWLNGLAGKEYLIGARAEFTDSENPSSSLMAGIVRIHVYLASPTPAQRIDFLIEYDTNYATTIL